MSSTLNPGHPRAIGHAVEAEAIQRIPALRYVTDSEARGYDAIVKGGLCPRVVEDVLFVGVPLIEDGTHVEIKGAQVALGDGQRGRWYIRQRQHERLVHDGAAYLLVVHGRRGNEVLAMALIMATSLDGLLPKGWTAVTGDRSEQGYRQLSWSRVISPTTVEESR